MKSPKAALSNMRKAKIERLLSTPPSGFWVSKRYRRTLSVVSVVFSYLYLLILLVPIPQILLGTVRDSQGVINLDKLDMIQSFIYSLANIIGSLSFYAPLICLTALLLLRSSMRRITSLPDEYLDELEIVNRDWAFKTGYLVIRRVGLVLSAIGFSTIFFLYVTRPRTWKWPSPSHPFQHVEDALQSYFGGLTQGGAFAFYFQVIALLTYVAYSFPIILLAWRESRFNEPLPIIEGQVFKEAPVFAKAYLKRVLLIVLGFVGCVLIGWLVPYSLMNGLAIIAVIFTSWFGIYVFIWSSIKTVQILKAKKTASLDSYLATTFFFLTQFLGIALLTILVLVTWIIPGQWNGGLSGIEPLAVILILGVLMIPAQVISVAFASKLGKTQHKRDVIS